MNKVKLDEVDHQILDILIDNTRVPFTDIAKRLFISAGTVHVRVKKMEDAGIIKGSSLNLDYVKLGYSFIAYVGIFLQKTQRINEVLEDLNKIPFVNNGSDWYYFGCVLSLKYEYIVCVGGWDSFKDVSNNAIRIYDLNQRIWIYGDEMPRLPQNTHGCSITLSQNETELHILSGNIHWCCDMKLLMSRVQLQLRKSLKTSL